ncbi:hypothetical protein ACFE04_014708 [Oxalis oulophora]
MYNNKDDVTLIPQRRRKTPSFSSTLLDSICRSIDESNGQNLTEQQLDFYRETTTTTTTTVNKQSHHHRHHRERSRSTVVDNWMEKQSESSSSNGSIRYFTNSSCGVTSSSSEESSCYTEKSNSHCYDFSRQKSKHVRSESDNSSSSTKQQSASNREAGGGFSRTKLKALKMYGDLLGKKPISPGGRISKILNSIFNSGSNSKKGSSMCSSSSTVVAMEDVSTNYDQPIKMKTSNSKSSSTTRSCLSQSQTTTPSTRGSSKYVNGVKRSVRFYPVSVIVDEDSRPCGKKYIYEDDDPKIMSFSNVRQMSKSSITKKNYGVNNIVSNYNREEEEDDVDDDDAMSCASSDLFELEHIIANNGRYREELPVFETTNIKTNRAIANGFIRRM